MDVNNPYLKQGPNKRPRQENAAPSVAAAGRFDENTGTIIDNTSSSRQNDNPQSRNDSDMFDDCGIDWDAAVLALDRVEQNRSESQLNQKQRNGGLSLSCSLSQNQKPSAPGNSSSTSFIAKAPPRPNTGALQRPPTGDGVGGKPPLPAAAQNLPHGTTRQPELLDRPSPWNPPRHRSPSPSTQKLKRPPPSPLQGAATAAAVDLQSSLPQALRFDPQKLEPVQDAFLKSLVKHAELSKPLKNGWKIFDHQKKAILRGLRMRRAIMAMDMGTGKTLTACVWAKAFSETFDNLTVLVICPVSLKEEWKRTAEGVTGLRVQAGSELECASESNQDSVWIGTWGKIPKSVPGDGPYIVICDEAHQMQSMGAQRTLNVLELVESSTRCVGTLLLTGTPMKNGKPLNLFPLLRACQHPLAFHDSGNQRQQLQRQREFEVHFCDGRQQSIGRGRLVWQANGASNLEQLRQLTSNHIVYLKKEDVLKELPGRKRVFRDVPVSHSFTLQHQKALQHLQSVYQSGSHGTSDKKNEAVLGAVQRLRLVSSQSKVEPTVQLALQILEKEPAIVLFSSFVDVCKAMAQKLEESGWSCELLTGETPAKKRQAMVDNFQNGLSPVFCCTFGAGGVGLTLTAACTVILLDRPWTPGESDQAEDRVRRIGQTREVTSWWMRSFALDRQIDALLDQKKQTSSAVLDGSSSVKGEESSTEPQKLSIFQMLKELIPSSDAMRQTSLLEFSQPICGQT